MNAFQALVLEPGVLETYDCQLPGNPSHCVWCYRVMQTLTITRHLLPVFDLKL